jgi:hypothetical protein
MYMPFQMLRKKSFSGKVGGGDLGEAIGTVQSTMIADGPIIVIPHPGIGEFLMIGDIIIETMFGAVDPGILIPFSTVL